jgi:hypothetical protein
MLQLPLYNEVKTYFPYHRKEVVKKFMLIAQCILRGNTVTLYKIRNEAGVALENRNLVKENIYKMFIRFFCIKCKDAFCIGIIYLIINILQLKDCVFIVMDRTNWKIGKTNINILYIGLLLPNGCFIPILFDPLEKRGNSNTAERQDILSRFCEIWQQNGQQRATFLGDREFIGTAWFASILKSGFSLVIRLRITDYFKDLCNQHNRTEERMNRVIAYSLKRYGYFRTQIELNDCKLYYIMLPIDVKKQRNKDEKYLVLISDNPNVKLVSEMYKMRWKIEVFFLNIKSNAFNVEDINFKDLEKVQLMLAILAFLYTLIQKEHLSNAKIIKDKIFKQTTAKRISIFKNSHADFKLKILNINHLWEFLTQNLDHLIPLNLKAFNNCFFLNIKSVQ